jgi:phosphoribosylformylglycinamidine cyclo-ligase
VFAWLREHGGVTEAEMLRTFNCGLGMLLVTPAAGADALIATLAAHGETARAVGEIIAGDAGPLVQYTGTL